VREYLTVCGACREVVGLAEGVRSLLVVVRKANRSMSRGEKRTRWDGESRDNSEWPQAAVAMRTGPETAWTESWMTVG
jgi:hypothetical protein